MLDSTTYQALAAAKIELAASQRALLDSDFIKRSGPSAKRNLQLFITDPGISKNVKKRALVALSALRHAMDQRDRGKRTKSSLKTLRASDFDELYPPGQKQPNTEPVRQGLRCIYNYNDLWKRLGHPYNPVVMQRGDNHVNHKTPGLFSRSGCRVEQRYLELMEDLSRNKERVKKNCTSAANVLSRWAEQEGYKTIFDINCERMDDFLSTRTLSQLRQARTCLHLIFETFKEAGLIKENPCPLLKDYEKAQRKRIRHIEDLAGPELAPIVRKFFKGIKNAKEKSTAKQHLDDLAIYLSFIENIDRWDQVAHDHLRHYQVEIFNSNAPKKLANVPYVTAFFDFIAEHGLLPDNPVANFRRGKVVRLGKRWYRSPRTLRSIIRSIRNIQKPRFSAGIGARHLSAIVPDRLSREYQFMLTRIIARIHVWHFSGRRAPAPEMPESLWDLAVKLKIAYRKDGKAYVRSEFIKQFRASGGELQCWANNVDMAYRASRTEHAPRLEPLFRLVA